MSFARKLAVSAAFTAAVVLGACTDRRADSGVPTAPTLTRDAQGALVMGACTTIGDLNALAQILFASSGPNVNSVLGKLDNLAKKVADGDVTSAQDQANNIVRFVQDKAAQGSLSGTSAQITAFISGVLCFAGLSPDTFLILPSDTAQIRIAADGLSGIKLAAGPVGVPTLLSFTTLDPNGPSPLTTLLDQYPAYVDLTISSPLTQPAIVAVCPSVSVPTDVRARLRLGHQASSGFEITPAADGSFLTCGAATAQSRIPGWLRNVASLIMPKPLYAAAFEVGGIGGSVTELSPFDAVDPVLSFAGGIGGSVTELIRVPDDSVLPPGVKRVQSLANIAGVCSVPVSATVGTQLDSDCRPRVTLATHNGTILKNVPVEWAVTMGGGTIAPANTSTDACGNFAASAATLTDLLGKAAICWTVGANGGTNRTTATPSAGGDAPAGVSFSPAALYFTAEALKITPTGSATGGSFIFDNAVHGGSGTCSNGLTPVLTYSSGAAPSTVGEHTLTVTCGANSTVYNEVSFTATISIAAAVPVIAVSCPATVTYTGAAQAPCTATAAAPGLSLTPEPVYTDNLNAGTATATVSLAASGNYAAASSSATFIIQAAPTATTVSCPASVTFTGAALTPCTATTTGPGGLAAATSVVHTANTNVGTASAAATFLAGGNYLGSAGTATFLITKAATTTTVSCPAAAVTYTGAAIAPCTAAVAGPGLSGALVPSYTSNVNAGTALAAATYAGGSNWLASSGTASFSIAPATTTVALSCPASVPYTGAAQAPCTATASGPDFSAVPVAVSYTPAAPVSAGGYSASAVFAGGGNYVGSANSSGFVITKLGATATAGSATINFGATVPTLPCAVSGLLSGEGGAVTCTTGIPAITLAGVYPTTPVVNPANPLNYAVTGVNGTLTVAAYKQVGCFSSPLYSVMPESKSAQRKGSNIPIKCTLQTPQGATVTTATGSVQVVDAGTTATVPPVKTGSVVFAANNVFRYSNSGNYAYGLDTGAPGFLVGHYYYVIATWNDGSKTEGWFLLKP